MSAAKFLLPAILFSFLYHSSWLKNVPGLNQEYLSNINKTLQLSISNKRNQTGHRITLFSLNNISPNLSGDWNVDFKQNVEEINGIQSIHVQGMFIEHPNDLVNDSVNKTDTGIKCAGYNLFPGIGYYKLYNTTQVTFDEALNTCFNDGGHLAIINSVEEAKIFKKLYAEYPTSGNYWVYLGFHDRIKEGEFRTIFGQHLNAAGYNKWRSGEPAMKNACGTFDYDGLLCTRTCTDKQPFLCEIPISS